MKPITRIVENEHDRALLVNLIGSYGLPLTVNIVEGKKRSTGQNHLQRKWCSEVSEQLGDQTPEEVRGYCKLTIGVPILRSENEIFCEKYDRIIKPHPYETKLEMMMEPLDFPVTRLMTTKQKTKYLDGVLRHWSERGLILTIPKESARAA